MIHEVACAAWTVRSGWIPEMPEELKAIIKEMG